MKFYSQTMFDRVKRAFGACQHQTKQVLSVALLSLVNNCMECENKVLGKEIFMAPLSALK
jgi:hypothetical protein